VKVSEKDRLEHFERLVRAGLQRGLSRRQLLRHGLALGLGLPSVVGALAACGAERRVIAPPSAIPTAIVRQPPAAPPQPTAPPSAPATIGLPTTTAVPEALPPSTAVQAATRFAAIGDFGMAGEPEGAVAALVKGWAPEFVLSLGDNNYPDGAAETIDANIGQYYHEFIYPYSGGYGPGAQSRRFFPVLGNHDWVVGYPRPYLDYFGLGEQRYYTFDWGAARFFMLDSMPGEPDGVSADSAQAQWLQRELAAATATWKIVVMHHPPFSSGHHGSSDWMQWPFRAWGANLVLAGHDHSYERMTIDGLTYLVNGLGGGARYAPGSQEVAGSQRFFNRDHGAMLVEISGPRLRAQFVTRAGELVDDFELSA
jgi:tartrate-resistant acid phosphatase type 5